NDRSLNAERGQDRAIIVGTVGGSKLHGLALCERIGAFVNAIATYGMPSLHQASAHRRIDSGVFVDGRMLGTAAQPVFPDEATADLRFWRQLPKDFVDVLFAIGHFQQTFRGDADRIE